MTLTHYTDDDPLRATYFTLQSLAVSVTIERSIQLSLSHNFNKLDW